MDERANKNDLDKIKDWLGAGSINIFGKPFSGKDTQAQRLAELLDTVSISSGDIIRKSDDEETKKIIATGKLAPTNAFINLVLPVLARSEYQGKPLILSSIGRWHGEEAAVVKFAKESGHTLKAVINLDIPDAVFYSRWEELKKLKDREAREDDKAESLGTRLDEFHSKTKPVIAYYQQQNLLITIDGTQDKATVTKEIIKQLLTKASQ